MSHLLLWGNAYAQIIRNARGEVVALYPLMPNKMTVDRDASGRLFYLYQRGTEDAKTLGKSAILSYTIKKRTWYNRIKQKWRKQK